MGISLVRRRIQVVAGNGIDEQLRANLTQLQRTNNDLDTFVYTASHDLKAPITTIESILLALREHLPAAALQDELVAQLLAMLQDRKAVPWPT